MSKQLHIIFSLFRFSLLKLFFIVCCLIISIPGLSQTSIPLVNYTIKGKVADSITKEPLEYATLELRMPQNTSPFKTITTTAAGTFEGINLSNQYFEIVITYLGYISKILSSPALSEPHINLGTILLVPLTNKLEEVRVSAKKSIITYEADKIVYNVDADSDRHAFNTFEMLRKLPGITIDAEDNVELNGSISFQVLLNGRPSSLFVSSVEEVFKSMPATSVKSIEIITAPSAKYDAEGVTGVINIITKSKIVKGYNVSLRAGYAEPGGPTGGGNIMASVGKIGLSAMWGYSVNQNPTTTNSFFRTDKRNNLDLIQTGEGSSRSKNIFGNAELTYQLSEASLLLVHYNRRERDGNSQFLQDVEMTGATGNLLQAYNNISRSNSIGSSEDYGVDLQLGSKKNKARLFTLSVKEATDANTYMSYNVLAPKVQSTLSGGNGTNESLFRERTAQADYVLPLKKHSLEMGLKRIERYNTSDYFFERYIASTGTYYPEAALSNQFNNRQNVDIAYLSLTLGLGKWILRGGSRFENFMQEADFISSGTKSKTTLRNIIPNASIAKRFGNITNLNISYTQRLQRPGLFYLNPFVNNIDPYNLFYGNPNLKPTLTNTFNLAFNTGVKRTSYNLNLFHNYTNGSILNYTYIGSDTVAHTTYGNIGTESSTGGSLGTNFSVGKYLYFGFNGSGSYLQFTSIINNKVQQNEGLNYSINHNGSFSIKTWRFSYNAGYTSARVSVQGKTIGYYNHSATAGKSFFKERKGNLNLSVNNPFQHFRTNLTEVDQENFYQLYNSQLLMRRFNLTFNYRFGKLKSGIKQLQRGIVNDDLKSQ